MNKKIRHIALTLCIALTTAIATAQTYRSEKLEKTAQKLGISNLLGTLQAGETFSVKAKDGQTVYVRTGSSPMIEHIGIPLFDIGMRKAIPSPVYDCLEYALLNWKYKISDNMVYLSKVIFKRGNWNTLLGEDMTRLPCSVTTKDSSLYIVNWTRDEQDIATIGVPIDYELLANDTRRNLERQFIDDLLYYQLTAVPSKPNLVTENDLKLYGTEGLFVMQGESYQLPELNQNIYYELKSVFEEVDTLLEGEIVTFQLEDVMPTAIVTPEHPLESLANLMLSDDTAVADACVTLDLHLSNWRREMIPIKCRQLREFFRQEGCRLFFAGMGISKENVQGMVLVTNLAKGYNHLLRLKMPVCQLTSDEPEIRADVYLYIPPLSKSRTFSKTPTKKSGAKIH